MATKTLEARFEHLSVNDENEISNGSTMLKSKVRDTKMYPDHSRLKVSSKALYPQRWP